MVRDKAFRRSRIKARVKGKIAGLTERPRLSVFRCIKAIYAQIIDDKKGTTMVAAHSRVEAISSAQASKVEKAFMVGKELAAKAIAAGVTEVVFDRNGYLYHGRVKALADGAREGGLKF